MTLAKVKRNGGVGPVVIVSKLGPYLYVDQCQYVLLSVGVTLDLLGVGARCPLFIRNEWPNELVMDLYTSGCVMCVCCVTSFLKF